MPAHRRHRRPAAVFALALLAASFAFGGTKGLQVPVRWCAVQGSPAVQNPACSCVAYTTWNLTARGFRASRAYRNCRALFRPSGSQGTSGIIPNVRVIADPCDPTVNPTCAGARGDIAIDWANNNLTEYFQVIAACRTAWNTADASAVGLIGVNIRRFVDMQGNPSNIAGLGGTPIFCNNASQAAAGQFAVTDDDFTLDYSNYPLAGGNILGDICGPGSPHPSTPPCLPQWITDSADSVTGHEIGHALSLNHLSGTVMNATTPSPMTMTMGGFGQNATVCPARPFPANPSSQCGTIRLQAVCHQNGTIVDPPPVVDEVPLSVGDVPVEIVDLDLVGLIDDGNTGTASLFWRVTAPPPSDASGLLYEFALDLDQNPSTGGDPFSVGIQVPLPGAELTGSVRVDVASGAATSTPSLYRWDTPAMGFVPEPVLGSDVQVLDVFVDEATPGNSSSGPAQTAVSIDFDRNLLSGVPSTYTLRARAFDPASAAEDLSSSSDVFMRETLLPVCQLAPAQAAPGEIVTVSASELTPDTNAIVWFDKGGAPFEVGGGLTDPAGAVSISFAIPADADPGLHEVAVLLDAPDSFSSHCTLDVLAPAGNPGESSSSASNQMLVTGYDRITGEVTVSYAPACGASDHTAYSGSLPNVSGYAWDRVACDLGTSGTATFDPGAGSRFFVIVGHNGAVEGSYGRDSAGAERPEDTETPSTCSHPQDLNGSCL